MLKAVFSFDGRTRRIHYFLTALVISIVSWIGNLFILIPYLGIILAIVVWIVCLWAMLANVVKRIHDVDKPAWWAVGMFIPLLNLVLGLYLLFADGTVGPNQFGEDPKNRAPFQGAQPSAVNVTVNVNKEKDEVEIEESIIAEGPAEK